MTAWLLTLAVVAVLALRHDYWNWDRPGYLLFGFLPVGLWWQALVSVLATCLMALLVRFAWPDDVEDQAMKAAPARAESPGSSEISHSPHVPGTPDAQEGQPK